MKSNKILTYAPERLCAMTDSILAIIITMLVVNITTFVVPEIEHWKDFSYFWSSSYLHFLNFFILFIIVSWMWLLHHTIFTPLQSVDRTVIMLNMASLVLMCCVPMCLDLIKDNPHHFLPTLFFWTVYSLLLGTFWLIMKNVEKKSTCITKMLWNKVL